MLFYVNNQFFNEVYTKLNAKVFILNDLYHLNFMRHDILFLFQIGSILNKPILIEKVFYEAIKLCGTF